MSPALFFAGAQAGRRQAPGQYRVLVDGLIQEASFARLEDALTALWQSLRVLPLGADQADALEALLTRQGAAATMQRWLDDPEQRGQVQAGFTFGGQSYVATIRDWAN